MFLGCVSKSGEPLQPSEFVKPTFSHLKNPNTFIYDQCAPNTVYAVKRHGINQLTKLKDSQHNPLNTLKMFLSETSSETISGKAEPKTSFLCMSDMTEQQGLRNLCPQTKYMTLWFLLHTLQHLFCFFLPLRVSPTHQRVIYSALLTSH